MNFIKNIIMGVFIGAGAIIPGVSSGVICVILGIYEKLLDSVLSIFKNFKENIKFLLPIGIGAICGMVLLGNTLKFLFYAYPVQISFIFIGLVMGSIPVLFKETEKKEEFKLKNIWFMFFSMIFGIAMVIAENRIAISSNTEFSFMYLVLVGICMSIGVVVPGVSSTVILMLLGVYSAYLTSVAEIYLPVLIPIGIGLALGSLISMKIIKYLLDNYYIQTFYSIIGFTIGSVFVLYPGISFDLTGLISVLCFFLGWTITGLLNWKQNILFILKL